MNHNLHIEDLLDELLKNKTTRADVIANLEKENVQDTAAEIDLHFAAARALQRYNILKQVQLVHKEYTAVEATHSVSAVPTAKLIQMKPVKWALRIAASVVLLIGLWFAYQYSATSSTTLYSEIYQPYNVNTDRGIGDIKTHNMVPAFKTENYEEVIKIFELLPVTNNREKFLAAYSYHVTGNYQKSLDVFQLVLTYNKQNNTRMYNDEAEFYSGLSFLKLKDSKSATQIFKNIRNNSNHTFHERVSKWTLTRLKWLK